MNWIDTLQNIEMFAFIAVLIWLMVKPIAPISRDDE